MPTARLHHDTPDAPRDQRASPVPGSQGRPQHHPPGLPSRLSKTSPAPLPGLPAPPLLTASREGSRRLVMAVDAHAASLGVRPGMAVAHAQAMVPGLRIEEAQPEQDAAALHRLAAWCLRQFSPLAAAYPPDGIWIDVTGCTHLFAGAGNGRNDTAGARDDSANRWKSATKGIRAVADTRDGSTGKPTNGAKAVHRTASDTQADEPEGTTGVHAAAGTWDGEAGLLHALTTYLANAGIASRAAIAETPGAAYALARYGQPASRPALPHLAPAPIIAPPGCTKAALASLPVAGLRLAEETVLALRTLGFDTIGQLMAAPRAPLAKRFGADVLRRLDQAIGAAFEPIEPAASPETPRTRQGFPEPISTPEDLARAAALLTDRLCEKLAQKGLGASRLDLVFQRVDGAQQAIRIGTAAATRDPGHLTRLLAAQIETIDPGFGIESVMLAAPLTARLDARQTLSELCATRHSPDLADLVDTLFNRLGTGPLGEARLFRVAPVQSDVPERSVRALPPLAPAEGADWPDRLPRPARLFTPPRRIEAVALLPDRAPAAFTWGRRVRRVRRADGPERIFGEWWREEGETWAVRDYFAVEDEAGQRFWLFRRGDGECTATGDLQWFLHGVFG